MTGVGAAASGVRRALRGVVEALSGGLAYAQMTYIARAAAGRPVVVLDIDNTLADSWPSFLAPHTSQRDRLARIEPLPNIKAVAHDAPVAAGAVAVFLSHRNLWEWPLTRSWLRSNGYPVAASRVVLVPRASAKPALVARLVGRGPVAVWDDLSYGHESGEVRRYDDVIAAVRALPVEYHGWDEIVAVTGRSADRDVAAGGGESPST